MHTGILGLDVESGDLVKCIEYAVEGFFDMDLMHRFLSLFTTDVYTSVVRACFFFCGGILRHGPHAPHKEI